MPRYEPSRLPGVLSVSLLLGLFFVSASADAQLPGGSPPPAHTAQVNPPGGMIPLLAIPPGQKVCFWGGSIYSPGSVNYVQDPRPQGQGHTVSYVCQQDGKWQVEGEHALQ